MPADSPPPPNRPRVLRLRLSGAAGLERRREAWSSSDPELDRAGGWSGGALALALLLEAERGRPPAEPPLVLAVGECVGRGVPTAARATVASRAPASGLFADGQVGGELGRRLAAVADAVVLEGAVEPGRGAVVVLAAGGEARLEFAPELVGNAPAERHRRLVERLGPCATLCVGPAGERGLPFASLAVGDVVPHYVGRGGLGAVLGRSGLAALAVTAPAVEGHADAPLLEALRASPRLEARARGGTLELFAARDVQGNLRARGEAEPVDHAGAARLADDIGRHERTRHGCAGCPTPCGWVFERRGGRGQGARFGAAHALGLNLGLAAFDDALALLAACDELGADAKDLGASLALVCTARERGLLPGPPAWGDAALLLDWLRDLGRERPRDPAVRRLLERGAVPLARELGLADRVRAVRGSPAGPEISLAALLGQCVSARGVDPMRTLAIGAAEGPEVLAASLSAGAAGTAGTAGPDGPLGPGTLVWWNENLATALDATGFCAFSAAALIGDGTCSLDELARGILPASLAAESGSSAPGSRLLAMGEALVVLQRRLNRAWGGPGAMDLPDWARERLDRPGLWPEYRRRRGLDARGDLLAVGPAPAGAPGDPPRAGTGAPAGVEASGPRARGVVTLTARGVLADTLGAECRVTLELPARLEQVLAVAAEAAPGTGVALLRGGRIVPGVWREGTRLAPRDAVRDGDRLDLLLVISGGSG